MIRKFIIFLIAILACISAGSAQENHALHHSEYRSWTNMNSYGCCNNQDCGEIADKDERTGSAGVIEVRIEGEWCQVKPWMYLKTGNAPDWSSAHVCVLRPNILDNRPPLPPCARLICYQPKPQF